jgi:single-stranded DNA-binding protein
MAEFKKKNRGDAFLTLEGTVGTVPDQDVIKTANGDLDVCNFRLVTTPYRPGQKEPEDMWFTVRVAGSHTKYAAGLVVGDFVSVRGGFYVREYKDKSGKDRIDLVLNADSSSNAIRRLSSAKPKANGDSNEAETSVVAETPAAVESLF